MQNLDWAQHEPAYRSEWETRYGDTGLQWMEVRDAHRFGWEAARRAEFAQSTFEDVEADLADHWYLPTVASEEMAWDYVREAVAEGWRQARRHLPTRSRQAAE